MTFKKGLLAAATATTVAIAGTGIASAQSAELSSDSTETENTGSDAAGSVSSIQGSSLLAPTEVECEDDDEDCDPNGGPSSLETLTEILESLTDFGGAVAGSIAVIPDIYSAVSDVQDIIDEILGNS